MNILNHIIRAGLKIITYNKQQPKHFKLLSDRVCTYRIILSHDQG